MAETEAVRYAFRYGFPRDGLVALALRRGRRQHQGEARHVSPLRL